MSTVDQQRRDAQEEGILRTADSTKGSQGSPPSSVECSFLFLGGLLLFLVAIPFLLF
jgi:hypothetical protein